MSASVAELLGILPPFAELHAHNSLSDNHDTSGHHGSDHESPYSVADSQPATVILAPCDSEDLGLESAPEPVALQTDPLVALLHRARKVSAGAYGEPGPEGSAKWLPGTPLPPTLLLSDLSVAGGPITLAHDFGCRPGLCFDGVTHLDLSGCRLVSLPEG